MALVQFAASAQHPMVTTQPTKTTGTRSDHETHKGRRIQKATPGCYFDTRFSPSRIIGDNSIVGVQSCLELRARADDDVLTGGRNHNHDLACSQSQDQKRGPQPRIGTHPPSSRSKIQFELQIQSQPLSNISDNDSDSISLYSTRSSIAPLATKQKHNNMESDLHLRRRSKTPVLFVGQLERKSVICTRTLDLDIALDKAQILADEYQAVLPLRLETSITNCNFENLNQSTKPSTLCLPRTPKRLRKIKCQLSLRDLVRQHSQCAPSSPSRSPSTPGSDTETLVGSPPCSPLDREFEKPSLTQLDSPTLAHRPLFSNRRNRSSQSDDEQSLPAFEAENDTNIGLKICTELLTNELATALLRHHSTSTAAEATDRASGLQILLMIEAYETVQQHVRRMLYDAHVTGKQFSHVRDAEGILEHWLKALYAVYDCEQEEESKRNRLEYEWPLRRSTESGRVVRGDGVIPCEK